MKEYQPTILLILLFFILMGFATGGIKITTSNSEYEKGYQEAEKWWMKTGAYAQGYERGQKDQYHFFLQMCGMEEFSGKYVGNVSVKEDLSFFLYKDDWKRFTCKEVLEANQ